MTELSERAGRAVESLETKPALDTPALIAQNEGIDRAAAEQGLAELEGAGLRQGVRGWAGSWKRQ